MVSILRHFSLKDCTLPKMVATISILLRLLSINVDPDYKKRIPIMCKVFTFLSSFCFFYVYVFSALWFVFIKCMETGDVISAMIAFAFCMSSEISTAKYICMLVYQDSLQNMIKKYLIHDSKCNTNARLVKNQLTVLKRVKRRAVIFWCMIIGNGVVYVTKPLLLPGRHFIEDTDYIYGKKPRIESPNYEIDYLLTLVSVNFACCVNTHISGFFTVVVGYIEAQMISLSEELVNIWDDAQENYYKNRDVAESSFGDETGEDLREKNIILNKCVKEKLQIIVDIHNTNISFLTQIESIFRGAFALEFGFLIISLIAELLGGLENTYLMLPFALNQVIMDCITGQKLIDASLIFQQAVYESKWENFDLSNMKTVLMILKNSQKTMSITAGGLTKLSYLSLMSVVKFIYSTYTTLRSTVNN